MRSQSFKNSDIREIHRELSVRLTRFFGGEGSRVTKFEELWFILFFLSKRRSDNGGYRTAWQKLEASGVVLIEDRSCQCARRARRFGART